MAGNNISFIFGIDNKFSHYLDRNTAIEREKNIINISRIVSDIVINRGFKLIQYMQNIIINIINICIEFNDKYYECSYSISDKKYSYKWTNISSNPYHMDKKIVLLEKTYNCEMRMKNMNMVDKRTGKIIKYYNRWNNFDDYFRENIYQKYQYGALPFKDNTLNLPVCLAIINKCVMPSESYVMCFDWILQQIMVESPILSDNKNDVIIKYNKITYIPNYDEIIKISQFVTNIQLNYDHKLHIFMRYIQYIEVNAVVCHFTMKLKQEYVKIFTDVSQLRDNFFEIIRQIFFAELKNHFDNKLYQEFHFDVTIEDNTAPRTIIKYTCDRFRAYDRSVMLNNENLRRCDEYKKMTEFFDKTIINKQNESENTYVLNNEDIKGTELEKIMRVIHPNNIFSDDYVLQILHNIFENINKIDKNIIITSNNYYNIVEMLNPQLAENILIYVNVLEQYDICCNLVKILME